MEYERAVAENKSLLYATASSNFLNIGIWTSFFDEQRRETKKEASFPRSLGFS